MAIDPAAPIKLPPDPDRRKSGCLVGGFAEFVAVILLIFLVTGLLIFFTAGLPLLQSGLPAR